MSRRLWEVLARAPLVIAAARASSARLDESIEGSKTLPKSSTKLIGIKH